MDNSALRLRRAAACLSIGVAVATAFSPQNARAGVLTGVPTQVTGATPFIETLTSNYSGGTLQSVGYSIQPISGSLTRPFAITYPASYLATTGGLASSGTAVTFSVFGLYAGITNTVTLSFTFTDGSVVTQPVMITTAAYKDPCSAFNTPTFTQNRVSTNQLNFDYFLIKDNCSSKSPAIVDTDGNFRWVGTSGIAAQASILYNNGIYLSNGSSGIDRIELTTGAVTTIGDYKASNNVTFTGHHNIDPGRDGLMLDVNTTTETESVNIEIDPITGAVLNSWDMGQIISAAMTAGGDNPAAFDLDINNSGTDWFHNNATAYNPADNTLIVSSRENFVIAVDYDTPADGQKKIHWILGDQTKNWGQFKSLTKYALTLEPGASGTMPPLPVGQHAVSIDHLGNLLLFDDGAPSLNQTPAGVTLPNSSVQEYIIDTVAMTATGGYSWTPTPALYNPYCGSVYDVNGTFLVDMPDLNNGSLVEFWGLDNLKNVVFNLTYPGGFCAGWNAVPLQNPVGSFAPAFTLSTAPATLTVPQGASGSDVITVNSDFGFDSPVNFTLTGLPPGVTALPPGITGSFLSSSSLTGTTLTVAASSTVALGTYPIRITGTFGATQASTTLTVIVGSPLPAQTITFGAIASQVEGTALALTATASSALPVSFSSSTLTVCTVSGSTATLVAAGTCTITASQAGNSKYAAAAPVSQSFIVVGQSQTITFAAIATQTVGATLGLSASASSTLAVSYASSTNPVCTISGSTASLLAPGTCTITASQAGNSKYAAAAPVSQSFMVVAPPPTAQTITFGAIATQTAGTSLGLSATASSTLPVSYSSSTPTVCTVSGPTATLVAAGTCTITASQAGNGSYAAAAPVSQSFAVAAPPPAAQTISFGAIATQTAGSMLGLSATASSTLAVSFASSTTAVCTVSGSTATLVSAGTCTITASQAGNGSYAAATAVSQSFTVTAAASSGGVGSSVSLTAVDNVYAIAKPNTFTFTGGFDGAGNSFAANLLGSSVTWSGSTFTLGSASTVSGTTGKIITLPAGNYSSLQFLASAAFGQQLNQVFTVTYTDGTTSTLTQSISDWGSSQKYPGESIAATTAYRVSLFGAAQSGPWYVYGYSIALNKSKTVRSLTLPSNRNIVVLAVDLVQSATVALPGGVALGAIDNVYALANVNTPTVGGGFDGAGYSFAANLLGPSVTWSGDTFTLGSASALSGAAGSTITLPTGSYSSLQFLASAAFGPALNQIFTVTYTDGTTSTLTQSMSDWGNSLKYPGESIAATTAYRITSNGAANTGPWYVYGYSIPLNKSKIVRSLTLPSNREVVVLAVDLNP